MPENTRPENLENNIDYAELARELLKGFRERFFMQPLGPASPCSGDRYITNLAYQRVTNKYGSADSK